MGRFLSPDEFPGGPVDAFSSNDPLPPGPLPYADISDPQSLNKYSYVLNNPARYIDPDGHDEWDVLGGIGKGAWNFVKNTVKAIAVMSIPAYGPLIAGQSAGESLKVAVKDYADKGVSGVANAVLDQGEGGAMEIVAEAVLTGGATAGALKAPIESAATGVRSIGTGVPNSNVVVLGGTAPLPPGKGVYSGSQGPTLLEAGKGVPNGQLQASTAGAVRRAGGQVTSAPEPAYRGGPVNPRHVNIRGGQQTFGPPWRSFVGKVQ